jgi:cation-transporting ATPase 13A2
MMLFGRNLIDVAGKSIFTLLIEEVHTLHDSFYFGNADQYICLSQVLHPFYVFQIASIILWSFDDYWYYGECFYA